VLAGFGDDTVLSYGGTNLILGGPGDDDLEAGQGRDVMIGGPHLIGDVCYPMFNSTNDCEFLRFSITHAKDLGFMP
jgi:hypothetical protein